ncbi:hypothetical protein EZV62_003161 [Acer yangbiense]|uniref:J domain-containing protein n=1 Tax=Acer yangbiense TaxID=1000413 RepID=A0A5C7IIA0_9ROSI|nr:hypothetical protein EZV62_003161 [Acer yangbiense]
MLLPPMEYLFNDIDHEALKSLLGKLSKEDDEFCKNKAEELYKQQNIDMAIYSIGSALVKNPKRIQTFQTYYKAYVVHKIAYKVNNWYAVLGIQDLTAGFDDINKQYNRLASAIRSCPSVAAESALRLVNAAWEVLSQPKIREAYDKQLFSSTEFLEMISRGRLMELEAILEPSTIADLYSTIASLIKESDSNTAKLIKESEERQLSSFRAKLSKIREEMKVGDRPAKKSTEDNSGTSKQKNDKVYEEDLNGEILCKLVEKSDVQGDDASNWKMENNDDAHKHSSDPMTDALADSKMIEDVDKQTILNETELKEINKCVDLCIEEIVQ